MAFKRSCGGKQIISIEGKIVKAVIFDLDGTLVHSAVNFVKLKKKTIDLLKHQGLSADYSTKMKTYDIMRFASIQFQQKGFTEHQIARVYRHIEEVWNRVELELVNNTVAVEGAVQVLHELKKCGIKIGVVTRGCREYAQEALRVTNLLDLIDVIVGRDDARPKPSPDPLIKAINTLGLQAREVLMVGDSLDDAQCANEAQVRFVGKISPSPTINIFNHTQYHALVNDLRELTNILGLS